MTTIASQITSLAAVYSTVYSDADQIKHQSSASLVLVWGSHRDRWIPRTKGQLRGKYFHLMTSSWLVSNLGMYFKSLSNYLYLIKLIWAPFIVSNQYQVAVFKDPWELTYCVHQLNRGSTSVGEIVVDINWFYVMCDQLHGDVIKWKPFPRYWPFVFRW